MARLVTELRARWYLWTETKNDKDKSAGFDDLDVAELLRVARDAVGGDRQRRSRSSTSTRPAARRTIDIGDWLRMVMRGDYRSLAMESLRAALDLPLTNDGTHPRETFFLTLAAYLLDSSDGVGESVARSAFRAAAKDLLLSQSHVGVPRSAIACGSAGCRGSRSSCRSTTPTPSPTATRAATSSRRTGRRS